MGRLEPWPRTTLDKDEATGIRAIAGEGMPGAAVEVVLDKEEAKASGEAKAIARSGVRQGGQCCGRGNVGEGGERRRARWVGQRMRS